MIFWVSFFIRKTVFKWAKSRKNEKQTTNHKTIFNICIFQDNIKEDRRLNTHGNVNDEYNYNHYYQQYYDNANGYDRYDLIFTILARWKSKHLILKPSTFEASLKASLDGY